MKNSILLLSLLSLSSFAPAQLQHNCRVDGIADGITVNGQMMLTVVGSGDIATFIDPKILPAGYARIRLRVITAVALDARQCQFGQSIPWFHDEASDIFSFQASILPNRVAQVNVPMQFNPLTGMTTTWRLDYCAIPSSSPCGYYAPSITGVLCAVETY